MRFVLAIASFFLASMDSERTFAFECSGNPWAQLFPASGDADIPVDTMLWLRRVNTNGTGGPPNVSLVEVESGLRFTVEFVEAPEDSRVLAFRVRPELNPNRDYRIDVADPGFQYLHRFSLFFQTGVHRATDGAAPTIPVLVNTHLESSDPDLLEAQFHASSVQQIVVAMRSGDIEGDPLAGEVALVGGAVSRGARAIATLHVGSFWCGSPNLDLSSGQANLRVGSFDPSGRFSDWSPDHHIEVPACGGGAPSDRAAMLLAAAFLLCRACLWGRPSR